ncbi:methylated-DNA--[protein]-cysteine S-methyltransferase [Pradoshia sp.]
MEIAKLDYPSPLGIIEIGSTNKAVCSLKFTEREEILYKKQIDTPAVLMDCYQQLDEYFQGERLEFTVPYKLEGTAFQERVWESLTSVSFGKTASYKEIALMAGNEKAVRAVGSTNGRNQICLLVPCHRIIGANGKMVGYAHGVWRKEWLLAHEKEIITNRGMHIHQPL